MITVYCVIESLHELSAILYTLKLCGERKRERGGGDWMYSYLKHVCYKMKIKKPVFVCDNIKSMTRSVYDFLPELKESFI